MASRPLVGVTEACQRAAGTRFLPLLLWPTIATSVPKRKIEIDTFEQKDAVIVHQADIGRGDPWPCNGSTFSGASSSEAFVEHIRDLELLRRPARI